VNRFLAIAGFLALLLAFATAGPATAAPQAGAAAKARPDLGLTKKSVVRLKSGRVSGAFVVRNGGRAGAKRFRAALSVKVAKKYRVIKRFRLRALKRKRARKVKVSVRLPRNLPAGRLPLRLCVDTSRRLKERSEKNNCRRVGTAVVKGKGGPKAPAPPVSSRPTNPVPFTKDTVFKLDNYWITVPQAYDSTHNTPTTLFVWSHGCGGQSEFDINTVSPGGTAQSWIAVTADGREGACWNVNTDPALIMGVVAKVKTHFNVNPRRVILGGYSSGGDLSYRTAYTNARSFAGVLAENTAPFRDTGLTPQQGISSAAWKFNIVHLAHTEDDAYPIATVRNEINALKGAGFPAELIERPGSHFDNDNGNTGTDFDLKTLLLPNLNKPWSAP